MDLTTSMTTRLYQKMAQSLSLPLFSHRATKSDMSSTTCKLGGGYLGTKQMLYAGNGGFKISHGRKKPSNPQNVSKAKEESCFWELFVPFALGYFTFNLNTGKKLANGVPIRYHSLSFIEPEAQTNCEQCLKSSKSGEVITLSGPPDIINVELFPDFKDDDDKTRKKNKENCEKWKDSSITNDGTVVVPISISNKKHVK